MRDEDKTKEQLIYELAELRQKLAKFEKEVAEFKKKRESLEDSETKFRLISETINEVFWMADVAINKMIYISPGYETIWGRTRQSLYENPRSFLDAIHPEDRQQVYADLEVQKHGQPFDLEYRIITANGDIRWIWDRGFPLKEETGNVNFYAGIASDITERKKIEKQLLGTAQRLELALYASKAGTWEWDIVNGRIEWSSQLYDIFGLDPRTTVASFDAWRSVMHPEDLKAAEDSIAQALKHRTMVNSDSRLVLPDGQIRWINAIGQGFYDDRGHAIQMLGICMDITNRKQAEEKLWKSEATARSLLAVPNAVGFLLDRNGICLDANETLCRRFGKNLSDIVGMSIWDLLPKDLSENRKAYFRQVLDTKKQVRYIDERNGIWNDSIMTPIFDNSGEVEEVAVFGFDVTELKKIEKELRASEARFRVIFEGTASGIIVADPETRRFRFVNSAICKMTGYTDSELLNLGVEDIHPEEDLPDIINSFDKLVLRENSHARYIRVKRKDSSVFFADISSTHIEMDNKEYLIGIFNDVSELWRAEEDLKNYRDHLEEMLAQRTEELNAVNEQLRQAQKLEAVGLLAGGIAHDFNNILTIIKGAVYILNKNIDEASPLATYPEQILSSIKKGTNLAQSLLAFSRKQTIILMPFDLNELINDSLILLHRLLGEHIEIVLALQKNLPFILGDRNQIQQVLTNLVANARDAMAKGGILTIKTGLFDIDETFIGKKGFGSVGEYILLEVADTGTGIEEKIRERIFDPFFTTKGPGKGSGLGLSVSYGIVKQHKGFIDFESISQTGSLFKIYLPSAKSEKYCLVKQETVYAGKEKDTKKGTKAILLAEDDAEVRTIIGDILRLEGYAVIETANGVEAKKLFTENQMDIDLVMLDVRMPGANGREVYKEIKRLRPETPVLFVSGYTAEIIESEGILREKLNFIPKSATPEELLEKIRQIIES